MTDSTPTDFCDAISSFFSVVYDLWEVFEEDFVHPGLTKPNNRVESGKDNDQS